MGLSLLEFTAWPLIAQAYAKLHCSSRHVTLMGMSKPLYLKMTCLLEGRQLMLLRSLHLLMHAALEVLSTWG